MTCLQIQMNQSVLHVNMGSHPIHSVGIIEVKANSNSATIKTNPQNISEQTKTKVYNDRNYKNDSKLPQPVGH